MRVGFIFGDWPALYVICNTMHSAYAWYFLCYAFKITMDSIAILAIWFSQSITG